MTFKFKKIIQPYFINILFLAKERTALDSGIETSNNCSDYCSNNNNSNCQPTTSCGQHQEVEPQDKGSCNNNNTEEQADCQVVANLAANQEGPLEHKKSGKFNLLLFYITYFVDLNFCFSSMFFCALPLKKTFCGNCSLLSFNY